MFLDDIVEAQKHGEAIGIVSVCSAHPWVLRAAMKSTPGTLLIESTCNQVNQMGGYTGMTPAKFVHYVHEIALEVNRPSNTILLGGDHLGPWVWQDENADLAMQKAEILIRDYVEAGYKKIHLDCSMRLADDPGIALDINLSAQRAARLAKIAETFGGGDVRYVIGTEVPLPGGVPDAEDGVHVTRIDDLQKTIDAMREAFLRLGLEAAWGRVLAVVVQPGVEFGDDFVFDYRPEAARDLVYYIESERQLIYEVHSTDYQLPHSLQNLVRDHFAILKVGPALTHAMREAIFALAMMEEELFPPDECSNLIATIDQVMIDQPKHWAKYYHGTPKQQAFQRKFSLSDRSRYYWSNAKTQQALARLRKNLENTPPPLSLVHQFLPNQAVRIREGVLENTPRAMVEDKISSLLADYYHACEA